MKHEAAGGIPDLEDIGSDSDLCRYYEGYMRTTDDILLNKGIYTLEDLKEFGEKKNICPYYLARQYLYRANIIVFNYAYMIDPKISSAVAGELQKECVVVFDECHNMDNACIEGLTLHIDRKMLQLAIKNIEKLKSLVDETKSINSSKLQNEYNQLLKNLQDSALGNSKYFKNDLLAFRKIDDKEINNIMPGNIRKADHFLAFVRRVIMFIKDQLAENELKIVHPTNFMYNLMHEQHWDKKGLLFAHDRLNSLLNTLEIVDIDDFASLKVIVDFGAMIASYEDGFSVIIDPYPEDDLILDPVLIFYCMDASIAVKPLFAKYRNVILTSGTISPLETYAKLLDFKPRILKTFGNTLPRNAIYPLIVSKGADQLQISSKFDDRDDTAIIRNYGSLLAELSATVPDGIVCFFPSYRYMEGIICKWDEMGIMQKILENKLIYIETKDLAQTVMALENYRKSCDCGRGAVFLSIARGKVAEGVDFQGHYGRCVMIVGIPFQYTLSRTLKWRLEFLKNKMGMEDSDFLIFDAMRQCAQCVGRVIRNKHDYGLMVFADKRYARKDKICKLPQWIQDEIEKKNTGISTDMAVQMAKSFFKDMGQPFEFPEGLLYDQKKLEELNW